MTPYSILAIILSFLVTLKLLPSWIYRAKKANLTGKDINKPDHKEVAELGGLAVICGFLAGSLTYIAISVFFYKSAPFTYTLFASLTAVLIATIIGLVDDILGWKIGLRQRQKMMLTIAIALPIVVINAGTSTMAIPLLGKVDFGLIYPLLFIPIAIIGASNAFNMIAGYNGLEAGMGIIMLTTLSYLSYKTGTYWIAVLGLCMTAALIAFLIYNFYPAKVFPGDTLTYSVGTMIAIIAIMGNLEKFALILFIPYILEFILKARGKMQKESFSKVLPDGSLTNLYDKWYGLEHIVISFLRKLKGKAHEWEVTFFFIAAESLLAVITLAYFFA